GVEADLDVVVDDAAVHRHGVHRVALGAGDGQRLGGIRAVAPADQIGGLGVGDGVAGGGYAGFAPHPHHVVVAVGAESRLSGVGIALTLTVQYRGLQQRSPLVGGLVIGVVDVDAVAAAALAVAEHQRAVLEPEEDRVGHRTLQLGVRHVRHPLQRGDVSRGRRAPVAQLVVVHVAGDVEVALTVGLDGDVVVTVPVDGGGQLLFGPLMAVEFAMGDGEDAVGAVVGDVLVVAIGDHRLPDVVTGPGVAHRDGVDDHLLRRIG